MVSIDRAAHDQEWEKREESRFADKSAWYRGEWDDEPDRVEWRYAGTPRFALLIVRGPRGPLCGYVGLPPGHPYHGADWTKCDVDAPGGLTYAAPCAEGGHICHVARLGETDEVYWLGFDCGHSWDYAGMTTREHEGDDGTLRFLVSPPGANGAGTYKSIGYVRRAVEKVAEQLSRVAKGLPAQEIEE